MFGIPAVVAPLTIDGLIAAVGRALAVMDADTRVIPGHGALSNRAEVREYADMLKTVRDRVAAVKRRSGTLDDARAARPTRGFDAQRGGGFVGSDAFVEAIWRSLQATP